MRRFVVGLAIALIAGTAPPGARGDEKQDQQISQQIVQVLKGHRDQGKLRGFDLDLQVENGVVWLKGTVASPEQQQLINSVANGTSGVTKVVDRLELKSARRTTEAAPAPSKNVFTGLTGAVKGVFSRSEEETAAPAVAQASAVAPAAATPAPARPQLSSRRGATPPPAVESAQPAADRAPQTVSLAQFAPPAEAAPAQPAAFPTHPNTAAQSVPDRQIVQRLLGKIEREKRSGMLVGFDADMHVDSGAVWLVGRVMSQEQKNLLLDIARREPGVQQVVDDLTVVGAPVMGRGVMPVSGVMPAAGGHQRPLPFAPANYHMASGPVAGPPPAGMPPAIPSYGGAPYGPAVYDHPQMPNYAYPAYSAYPNYASVAYPKQYSPSAWPYIGPFYPYPQVPLGWRRVTLEWDDGWWYLDFKNKYD